MRRSAGCLLVWVALGILGVPEAAAAPTLRFRVDQRGDFLLVGNTLGQECDPSAPPPVVGSVGACGNSLGDSAPDVFWRSESPGPNQAEADDDIPATNARSTVFLDIPAGATVTRAFLYWGSRGTTADPLVTLSRPGGFSAAIPALATFNANPGGNAGWQAVADVTALVAAQGTGPYNLADVALADFVDVNDAVNFGAWSMIVLYESPSESLRNLAVFDGLDGVSNGNSQDVTLDGFLVPNAGFDGTLGVITYEGDDQATGDELVFEGTPLSNALNPANNFFNSSRTRLGVPVSTVGDLPQLSGGPRSMSSFDLDVVDVTPLLSGGQTSAALRAASSGDIYYLGAFVTSISTRAPDLTTTIKTASDVDGPPLLVGDTVEFAITIQNTGNDDAVDLILTDVLPGGLALVPGTLRVDGGPALTEAPGDDAFDFDAGTETLVVRLGEGADAGDGGLLLQGAITTVTFDVTVEVGASGVLENQATVSAGGLLGAPVLVWPTGSADGPGLPTPIPVDACGVSADCPAGTAICDVTTSPNRCVGCLADEDCDGRLPTCEVVSGTCQCVAVGAETCNGRDDDCNGSVDEGDPGGGADCATGLPGICATGVSACQDAALACVPDVLPGTQEDLCGDRLDQDCDGTPDQGCGDSDGDGLSDQIELGLDLDPNDADSDDDGVVDGAEVDFDQDSDEDGSINALDPDSDGDGLFDGTELGLGCDGPDTDPGAGLCVADGDRGRSTTSMIDPDSDDGGVSDGDEDADHDGIVDEGETDPNDPTDDVGCETDAECGDPSSGRICSEARACAEGCRGTNGNGCPEGETCTSVDASVGACIPDGSGGGGNGPAGSTSASGEGGAVAGGGSPDESDPQLSGNGLRCSASMARGTGEGTPWLLASVLALRLLRRRSIRGSRPPRPVVVSPTRPRGHVSLTSGGRGPRSWRR